MGEERIQHAFFCLLRLGLWEARQEHPAACFPLETLQWERLYQLAINHTVEGVLFDGLQKLPTEFLPDKTLRLRWTVRVDAIERRNLWMNKIIAAQTRVFKQQQIQPVLLKGQGLAQCYPNPNRRICGDIDWYIADKASYTRLYALFRSRNLNPEKQAGFSFSVLWNKCDTELHARLLDIHNPFLNRYLKRLEKQEQPHRQAMVLDGETIVLPSAALTLVQVNAHILKHLLSFGIGIRQLCDSARVCWQYGPALDGQRLKRLYEKLGIRKWIDLLHLVLVKYMGLDARLLPFPLPEGLEADWMMQEILTAGNFGFHDERVDLAREEATNGRVDSFKRWRRNFRLYVRYAPYETCFFPFVQYYSRFLK
ncbi:nucleotidyltransferase family protein [Sphingobacterium griseoflavum]|uniref:Nucleotidyltransferase n=1 Tax=Sphingobacterium griseoflavum TaxID=1474952 RepID=A0ABQ3HZX5_9SPHI|nr:nucleotidyltransferase family protein [Sphingobacterium griseoflavum]GHE39828.1 hypothetical protein GCM10017764_23950 [Sphingobacterium griseoflavum]